MSGNTKTVKIYMMPIEYPCGPQSSCCGPIGQSDEMIQELRNAIEKELNLTVEVINVRRIKISDASVIRLFNTFGPMALPIIALNSKILSMGTLMPEQTIQVIKENL